VNIDLFAFLDGISPWWWVALALALGVAELLTFTYFLLWLGLAAFTVALLLALFPELSGTLQVFAFAVLAIFYTVAGWAWLRRRQPGEEHPGLNRRAAAMIGRQAVAVGAFRAGVGWVEIDGIRWRARVKDRTETPTEGDTVTITGVDGTTLIVAIRSESGRP